MKLERFIATVLLGLFVCLSLAGCSSDPTQSEYQQVLDEKSRLESQVSALEERLKATPAPTPIITPDPTPVSMKTIEFQGVQLSIPEDWKEKDTSEEGGITWYPYSDIVSAVVLQIADMGESTSISDPLYREAGIASIASSYEDYTKRFTNDGMIGGYPGFVHGFYGTVNGTPMSARLYGTSVGSYWVLWIFMIEKDSDSAIRDDFSEVTDKVIASINFDKLEELAQTAESKSEPTPTPAPTPSVTASQRNALKKAHSYLDFTAFSYQGLIEQLEYEKFSHEDAVYAADNCGANWNEQAAKKAQSYLDFTSFSRDGLIEQLEYEGFTHEQAVYGVDSVGL